MIIHPRARHQTQPGVTSVDQYSPVSTAPPPPAGLSPSVTLVPPLSTPSVWSGPDGRQTEAENSLEFVTGTPKAKPDTSASIPTDGQTGQTDRRTDDRPTCGLTGVQTDRRRDRETHSY